MNPIHAFELGDSEQINRLLGRRKRSAGRRQEEHRLLCAACGRPVTDAASRIDHNGTHRHRFTNPLGLEFEIGCFQAAPGCAPQGPATLENTWFAGYRWRIGVCRGCGVHLGWEYRGGDGGFYGLILDRLREEKL